jgi:hypothetical protein
MPFLFDERPSHYVSYVDTSSGWVYCAIVRPDRQRSGLQVVAPVVVHVASSRAVIAVYWIQDDRSVTSKYCFN